MFQGTLIFCTTLINDQILAEATVLHVIYMLTTSIFTPFFVYSPQYFFQETQRIFKFQPLVLGIQFGSQKRLRFSPFFGSRSTGRPEQKTTARGWKPGGEAVWQQDCDLWCRHGMAWAARLP